jgi:hypothetical protein
MDINDVKQIRWIQNGKSSWEHVRWYGVSQALTLDEKKQSEAVITKPVQNDNWCELTDTGILVANELLTIPGISFVSIGAYSVSVIKEESTPWEHLHEIITVLLNGLIFGDQASICELVERKSGDALIRWSDSEVEPGRIYTLSGSLYESENEKSLVLVYKQLEPESHGLRRQAIAAINAIFALKGVTKIWVKSNSLHIEVAKVFEIENYHDHILAILSQISETPTFVEKAIDSKVMFQVY